MESIISLISVINRHTVGNLVVIAAGDTLQTGKDSVVELSLTVLEMVRL